MGEGRVMRSVWGWVTKSVWRKPELLRVVVDRWEGDWMLGDQLLEKPEG